MSRVSYWIQQQTQPNDEEEIRLTVRLDAPLHEALKRVAEAVGMSKTACATHLLSQAIQDAVDELEAGKSVSPDDHRGHTKDTNGKAQEDFAHITTYARMKGNTTMQQLFHLTETALTFGPDVEVRPKSRYFGFWRNGQVFAYVHIKRDHIQIDVKPELPLQPGLIEVVDGNTCTRRIIIRTESDIDTVKPELRKCYNAA